MRSLSEMFNVNYFLVSQTNPHIVPALNLKKRVNRKLGNILEAEWKHRCVCVKAASPLHSTLLSAAPGVSAVPHTVSHMPGSRGCRRA